MKNPEENLAFSRLRQIAIDQLCSMLPGTSIDEIPIPSDSQKDRAQSVDATTLLLQPKGVSAFQLQLKGSRAFDETEKKIVKSFVEALGEIWKAVDEPYFPSLIQYCDQDVVARSVKRKNIDDTLIPSILRLFDTWSSQTYEGGRITAAIGIDPNPQSSNISRIHFSEFIHKDFTKVLTNGMDVLLVLSPSGHVVEHIALSNDNVSPKKQSLFAPIRVMSLARWADQGRVAIVLNRLGETLLLDNSQLRFAKRRGSWYHLAHAAVIHSMGNKISHNILKSVYETCLDISFGRHGGCIAIAQTGKDHILNDCLPLSERLSSQQNDRTRVLHHCIGANFSKLPRLTRLAIASADGAVVLDQSGNLIAAGSIVKVKGGSESGGRRAAAVALSRTGLAIKISADGGITCFSNVNATGDPKILFELCT